MLQSIELSALLISIIAGIFLGIPSGPAHFFVLDTCLKESKAAALKVYGGFLASKMLYVGLALLANDFISSHKKVETIFYLLASVLLAVWGVVIVFKSNNIDNSSNRTIGTGSLYKAGFVVGISNPIIPFIYLTFVQFIKIYARDVTILKYILNITILELVSFLVLATIAWMLLRGGDAVQHNWNKIVKLMGVFLICAGTYQTYQLIDFKNGDFHLKSEENVLEEQLEVIEEETKG